jgi:hypothetical protein
VASDTSTLPALRRLLRERFPLAARGSDTAFATGIPALDEQAGGLPRPALTEIVCSAPSCGSQLLFGQLLETTRGAAMRVALVDAGDEFDPASWPAPVLEHLVWIRAGHAAQALAAADLLVRDANLGLVALDLRHSPLSELRRIPSTQWYRLQRAIQSTTLAAVVLTPFPLVPSAQLRIELATSHPLTAQNAARPQLIMSLAPEVRRQRSAAQFLAS